MVGGERHLRCSTPPLYLVIYMNVWQIARVHVDLRLPMHEEGILEPK